MNNIIGSRTPIDDALAKATGEATYTADIKLANMCYGKLILSTIAFGKVKSINYTEALKIEGVIDVLTYKDFPNIKYNSALRFKDHGILKTETVISETVRFVGDRIGLVIAESLAIAEKALKLIEVEYEEYKPVFDEEEAATSSIQLHEGLNNKVGTISTGADAETVADLISKADFIIEDKIKIPMVNHVSLETYSVIGEYRSKKITVYASTQNSFAVRVLISDVFNMPLNKVRVIQPTLGGAFGGKLEVVTELVAAGAAMKVKRPVKIVLSRKESMIASRTRNGATIDVKSGVNKDGTIVATDFKILINTGAYVGSGMNVIGAMSHKLLKAYKYPLRYTGSPVVTNTPIAGAMRGYGSPQAFLGMNLHIDKIAMTLGVDPVELNMKHIVDKNEVDILAFGNPELKACVTRGKELFDWESKKKEISKFNKKNQDFIRGIGFGIGAHGAGVYPAHQDCVNLLLRLNEDGSFNYWSASHDMGNGSLTAQKMIMSEVLTTDVEDIEATQVNTETCPWNLGDYASRGVFVEGQGAYKLADAMKNLILETSVLKFKVHKEALSIKDKKVWLDDKPLGSFGDIAVYAQTTLQKELSVLVDHHSIAGRTSYGAHFAEVEINRENGAVKVLDYVAVHDSGTIINRYGIEGQLEGGIHMGIGYALSEKMTFDEKGNLLENNLKKYQIFKSNEMPEIKVDFIETGDNGGPFGAKSISECATVPSAQTIINAVANAIGEHTNTIPISKEEILNIINK
ncbi:MAG: molybdopterin-dependent oxidoreductase [Firmicutes bacterium]|nr:molybdopterin-dependent oxidoreductase [Bacillota bacterium]